MADIHHRLGQHHHVAEANEAGGQIIAKHCGQQHGVIGAVTGGNGNATSRLGTPHNASANLQDGKDVDGQRDEPR